MKVLLDHNMPVQVSSLLIEHEVYTARKMLWDLLENGDLLKAAEEADFRIIVTGDKSIYYQQNNQLRKIALVVLSTNDWPSLAQNAEAITAAVARASQGTFELVQITMDRSRLRR